MKLLNKNRCKNKIHLIIIIFALFGFFIIHSLLIDENLNFIKKNHLQKSPKIAASVSSLWNFTRGGMEIVLSSAALGDIDGDNLLEVIFSYSDHKVYALNGEDGSELWNFTMVMDAEISPSLGDVDGDSLLEVVFGNNEGKVFVLNGEDGSELWNYTTGDEIRSSPALGDVNNDSIVEVVIGSQDGKVYVLNGVDGSEFWNTTIGWHIASSPALGDVDNDGKLEIIINGGGPPGEKVYALNGEDGSEEWSFSVSDPIENSPVLGDVDDDGRLEVIIGTMGMAFGRIYVLSGENGNEQWNYPTGDSIRCTPALGDIDEDGLLEIVIGSNDWRVYALNGEDGSELWNYTTGDGVVTSPALCDLDDDNKLEVLIGSRDRNLYALNGEDGNEVWNYTMEGGMITSPALGDIDNDGNFEIIIGNQYKVYALKLMNSGNRIYWNGFSGDSNFTRWKNQAYHDYDYDMLSNFSEAIYNTHPDDPDTDNDNLLDGNEISGTYGYVTNATNEDTDYDNLRDDYEYSYNTNPIDPDTDQDNLLDGNEISGAHGYITNATNEDTDDDNLRDDYEYSYNTNPIDPDTDQDNLLDGNEISGTHGYVTNATNGDTDYDDLRDDYEYGNSTNPLDPDSDNDNVLDGEELTYGLDGYITNASNSDTDFDTFNDGIEFNLGTNPNNDKWYPMPNLEVSNFTVSDVYENQPFVLDFTITNNGIWSAEDITIIILCERLNITLYNNTDSPFNLIIDESKHIVADYTEISSPGVYVLTIIVDPNNLINETYSSKDGTFRSDWQSDNSMQIQMQIITLNGRGLDIAELIIWVALISVAVIIGLTGAIVIKRHNNKRKILKENLSKAKEEINEFEEKVRIFIKSQLESFYKKDWWEKGIPQYIRNTIEPKLNSKALKRPDLVLDPTIFLNLNHYFPIISEKRNWENIFSYSFSLLNNVEEPFNNLKQFKNRLYQNQVTIRELAKYSIYIYAIEKYFKKDINVFLSYSTLDSGHFKIHEIAKKLEKYPEIDKIFFWEVDSGEDIVDYMEKALQLSKIFILFCSENSIKSQAVEDEWKAAFQLRKKKLMKVIPVYEDERFIPALLTPLLNVKFDKDNFEEFIENLYKEILRS